MERRKKKRMEIERVIKRKDEKEMAGNTRRMEIKRNRKKEECGKKQIGQKQKIGKKREWETKGRIKIWIKKDMNKIEDVQKNNFHKNE